MQVRVLFFGMLKDLVGRSGEECEFPPGASLRSVFDLYAGRYPRLRELAPSIVMARNQEFAKLSTCLEEGDEVAFLPPVSGGAGTDPLEVSADGHYFALTRHAIDTRAVIARLMTGAEGAVVTFEGTVRNNTKGRPTLCLDYECYESMALKMMMRIGQEIAAAHPISTHRHRPPARPHAHRRDQRRGDCHWLRTGGPAFEAALEGIDRLKKTVPIWKKEHFVDGEVWVEGEWSDHVPVAG